MSLATPAKTLVALPAHARSPSRNRWLRVIFSRGNVGRIANIRRVIIDKGVLIPEDVRIGFDPEEGEEHRFLVSLGGVPVIANAENVGLLLAKFT